MKLYHISDKNMGNTPILHPRNLEDDVLIINEEWFPQRICVAPSIAQCLLAIPEHSLDGRKGLWVYSTQAKRKHYRCGTEYDTAVTQEKWLLVPHKFQLEARLSGEISIFIRKWVYSDDYGHEVYLSRKDRLNLLRIKLRGIRVFMRDSAHVKRFAKKRNVCFQ